MNHKEQMEQFIRLIEQRLQEYLPMENNLQKMIYEAMGYSLFAGGKRIRPVMMLAFCKMCGKEEEKALPFACALEMIHTYSLIHDDLPCMDNDDLRRGKPTNHKVFGENMAVLAGDALLNKAFETVCNEAKTTSEVTMKALGVLAYESGSQGMIGGQVVDLQSEGMSQGISVEMLGYLENLKTSALFRAAAKIGCIVGGGSEEQIKAAEAFATKLGLAFQIKDDILDVEGNEAILGKPIGSDKSSQKATFVSLLSLARAKTQVQTLTNEAIAHLDCFEEKEFCVYLASMLIDREK